MNTRTSRPFLLLVLLAGLGLMLAGHAPAQTFTNLHTFTAFINSTNSDGASPEVGLVLSGSTLYGTAYYGGTNGEGTVFAVNTDGTDFTTLHSFAAEADAFPAQILTNGDGALPYGGLILSGNTLYGTAYFGGTNGNGTVFAINTNGLGFITLHSFTAGSGYWPNAVTNNDGAKPGGARLLLWGSTLYGTTTTGGSSGVGTVFAMDVNGTSFIPLHSFTALSAPYYNGGMNSDGAVPFGSLVLSGNTLYGTADYGGTNGHGTLFAVSTSGSVFATLHTFSAEVTNALGFYTNGDGAGPYGGLVLSGNTLYGTTSGGGSSGEGTVFALNTDGTGFTTLYNFTSVSGSRSTGLTNSDGVGPNGSLILSGNTLYGTTRNGGSGGNGTVFAVNTDGTGFTSLYCFTFSRQYPYLSTNSDGAHPNPVILSGNNLYGTAVTGGVPGEGTVFSLVVPITLFYQNIGSAIVLSWNDPSFVLQSAPAVTGTYTNIPGATSPYTNTLTGPQQFFRLLVSQ